MYIQDINCYASVLYCLLTYFTVGLVHFFVAVLFAICTVFRTIKSNAKQTLANCFLLCLYTLEVIYMNAVIYARYSSDNQREESIEGQIRECKTFAQRNGMTIVGEYIDRAKSATTDKRPEFQRMIAESSKKAFEIIIVWKLDRFARNRYDSAHYKAQLRKNGVKVISATESISEGAEGVLLESVLEGMAEYYSKELGEKTLRGMTENALKCKHNGGLCPLGFTVDENKLRFYLEQFKGIDSTKLVNRRKLINTFVNPIYLYDDKLDLILNYQDGTETISLSEVEAFDSSSPVTSEGEPGLGKTLLAKCFIDECGLKSYTLRSNKGGDKFVDEITATFEKAKQNAPSIIFLDDMDKFANDDDMHCDAQEYVAVQAGIDFVKGSDVFVIATTNDINKLPDSLVRTGRFDRVVIVQPPTQDDASKIIEHYLKNKKLSDDVDFNDLCKMMTYHSCSDLETLLNEAAIRAGYGKKDCIEMEDLINAVLRLQYKSPDELLQKDKDEIRKTAIHEAGHIVVSEVLNSESVGLASIRSKGRSRIGGFIHKCKDDESLQNQVMICLAGKVATEMYYSDTCASGCWSDFKSVINLIRNGLTEEGTNGVSFLEFKNYCYELSTRAADNREAVVHAELERYILQTRAVLIKNKEFLEKTAEALAEKETLLYSDIQSIKNSVTITKCVA